ncbi:MAG: ATP-binding protein [Vicinamibacterales bacterium]
MTSAVLTDPPATTETPATTDPTAALHPLAPMTLEQAGLRIDMVMQLVLKNLYFAGELSGLELAHRLGLAFSVLEPALDQIKRLQECEITGMIGGESYGRRITTPSPASLGIFDDRRVTTQGTAGHAIPGVAVSDDSHSGIGGASYNYRITTLGRERAQLFLDGNHYVGVAPVPLAQYQDYLERYRASVPRTVTPSKVRAAFSHIVLSDRVLDQIGPAIVAAHSMFMYGAPGNGKTLIAQGIQNLLEGEIAVPHAIEVEGSIIKLFDPVIHEVLADAPDAPGLDRGPRRDARWARCRRPMVMVGGELTLNSLELAYSPTMKFYTAPIQAVANGGVLVIDDFGRQQCSPASLLNRWIVPLESRVDFLTLTTGQKIELPFLPLVVFATNINPAELVDEAFLRRIHYKVAAESPTVADFRRIFEACCRARGVAYEEWLVDWLIDDYYQPRGIPMRGCQPRDLIEHALGLAEYLGAPRQLTPALLEAACAGYFVDDSTGGSA